MHMPTMVKEEPKKMEKRMKSASYREPERMLMTMRRRPWKDSIQATEDSEDEEENSW